MSRHILPLAWSCALALAASCAGDSGSDADGDGWTTAQGDCDDEDPATHPDAEDYAGDQLDQNCDGTDGVDVDGDGSAAAWSGGEDCNDEDAGVWPGAHETCDERDEDCDGSVDEEPIDGTTWYTDADGDGFGDALTATDACDPPSGAVDDGTDCDDADDDVNPDEEECAFDLVDNDCDPETTDGQSTVAPELVSVSCGNGGMVSWDGGEVPSLQIDIEATDADGDLRIASAMVVWDRDVDGEVDSDTESRAETSTDAGPARCEGVDETELSVLVLVNGEDISFEREYEWALTVSDSGGYTSDAYVFTCTTPAEDGTGGGS